MIVPGVVWEVVASSGGRWWTDDGGKWCGRLAVLRVDSGKRGVVGDSIRDSGSGTGNGILWCGETTMGSSPGEKKRAKSSAGRAGRDPRKSSVIGPISLLYHSPDVALRTSPGWLWKVSRREVEW